MKLENITSVRSRQSRESLEPKMTTPPTREIDPEDFIKSLLAVTPEDAAKVREIADTKAKPDAKRAERSQ